MSTGRDPLLHRHQLITADGETRLMDVARGPIKLPRNASAAATAADVIVLAVDVTTSATALLELGGRAADRSQAVIEFQLDGTITAVNHYFSDLIGYNAGEMLGQNHSMLVDPVEAASPEYADLWDRLRTGEQISGGTSFWAAGPRRSGSGPLSSPCTASTASPPRSSSTRSTPPPTSCARPSSRARWRRSAVPRR